MNEKNRTEEFKEHMLETMKKNFEKDGHLQPIFFALRSNDEAVISPIPGEFLKDYDSKFALATGIKQACKSKSVECAGIIMEAYARAEKPGSEMSKLLVSGDLRVSELKEKSDIIMMLFSTPEHEEIISFHVDCKAKTIGAQIAKGIGELGGVFSNFFELRK